MSEARDQQPGFDPTQPTRAEEERRKLAESVVNIAAVVQGDPDMRPEEVKTFEITVKKPLERLAPGQASKTASTDSVQRLTGRFRNDMEFPGSKSIKQIIKWVEDHL